MGRYVALLIGDSYNYFNIAGVPKHLDEYYRQYELEQLKGYIDNSSISKVDRVIAFSKNNTGKSQLYISSEIDSISKEIYEFETMEITANGLMRFGIYDREGNLKEGANSRITRAGKPAKCIWCHETGVQPIFREQQDHPAYLNAQAFKDSLAYFDKKLRAYQKIIWQNKLIKNKRLHTEMELAYISFMEPSLERISREWQLSRSDVKVKLQGLSTHVHEEFPQLGELYHRKDIDSLAPFQSLSAPVSVREKLLESR